PSQRKHAAFGKNAGRAKKSRGGCRSRPSRFVAMAEARRRAELEEDEAMRFMVMHKMTDEMEKGLPPEQSIIDGVGELIAEAAKQNAFVSGEGLKPSAQRVHIAYKNGKRTVTDGPFVEAKELVAGFALMR